MVQGRNFIFTITPQKGTKILNKYDFVIPIGLTPDEMEALVLAQVRETEKLNEKPPADASSTQPPS